MKKTPIGEVILLRVSEIFILVPPRLLRQHYIISVSLMSPTTIKTAPISA
jgi:hypothetical protein